MFDCDNDGINEAENQTGDYTCTYNSAGVYTVKITGSFPRIYFYYSSIEDIKDNEKILSIEQWGTQEWTSMKYAFYMCSNLVLNTMDVPNLSSVTSTRGMFWFAESFNQDISSWNVSNVEDMSSMFWGASSFNQNISSWNVSSVTDMSYMFSFTNSFNKDISSWNVSSVTDMKNMFYYANSFNQNLSSWVVDQVTDCESFSSGSNWTLPKPNFTSCTP